MIRYSEQTVEIFHKSIRIACHTRSNVPARFTTIKEHMPESHRRHLELTPARLFQWASQIGPETREQIKRVLESRVFPEQGYRSCLGIMRLNKTYSADRLESACRRANLIGSTSFGSIDSILKKGLDRWDVESLKSLQIEHENIRGQSYYVDQREGGMPC